MINSNHLESKIVGGSRVVTRVRKTPAISIRRNDFHYCAGALISKYFAASLAQCLYEIKAAKLRDQLLSESRGCDNYFYDITFGETSRSQSHIRFIEDVHIHDQYVPSNEGSFSPYDIGVLKV